jgi:hypothetical protein
LHLIGRRDDDRTTHRFLRGYLLLWHTVSTRHVRSVSEVAFHHHESRDRDLRNLAHWHGIVQYSKSFGIRETPEIRGAETENLIPRLSCNWLLALSLNSMSPRLQLKFVIATAFQSKISAIAQISITFRERFLTYLMVSFRVRVMA